MQYKFCLTRICPLHAAPIRSCLHEVFVFQVSVRPLQDLSWPTTKLIRWTAATSPLVHFSGHPKHVPATCIELCCHPWLMEDQWCEPNRREAWFGHRQPTWLMGWWILYGLSSFTNAGIPLWNPLDDSWFFVWDLEVWNWTPFDSCRKTLLHWGPFKDQTSNGPIKYGPHESNTSNENPKCDLPGSSVLQDELYLLSNWWPCQEQTWDCDQTDKWGMTHDEWKHISVLHHQLISSLTSYLSTQSPSSSRSGIFSTYASATHLPLSGS